MKKLLFIINPMAGRQQAQTDLYKMVKIFADHDYEVTVYPTRARLDCTRKVLEDAGRFDLVVCCGGDGTLNEMVSGMMQRQDRRPMGYIPLGSTNDLAVSLRLPTRVEEAALRAVTGNEFHMDVGTLNDRYFNYIAAFGAFTETSYATPRRSKMPSVTWPIFWRASRAWARFCPSMSKSPPMTSSSRRITSSAPSPIPSPWAAS